MTKTIGIIGGGIIGLSSAYYLIKAGHNVTIIDKGDLTDGCSFGNAGMIVPSHFIPLAAPGMISKGIRWMFRSTSPFYVKPRLDPDLLKWGLQFYKHSNERHVSRSAPALKGLSLLSRSLYGQWEKELPFDFGYHERGLMMLFQSKETEAEEKETAHAANKLGIEARVLSAAEVQQLEPDVKVNARGGVYFPGDTHLTPQQLVKGLISFLRTSGVTFITSAEITDIEVKGRRIEALIASDRSLSFDEYVLAAGSWSGLVAKKLQKLNKSGLNLPMQAGKGYSFTLDNVAKNIRIPSILLEARVAVTPMGSSLRFGGTMEIGGINHEINLNRVRGIVDAIPKYYPEMKVGFPDKIWHGLRPCSPDGLPYIGRTIAIENLVVATGHSMMGMSLGPATGKIVSDVVDARQPEVDITMFSPERFTPERSK
ncbi:MAG TPA: FAD-dependent oxidoreductase [Cyclobacteriaceae bacterium]|nr:FAD-dependent oxidoreductase [Cyclobacteriaceae bacterium]